MLPSYSVEWSSRSEHDSIATRTTNWFCKSSTRNLSPCIYIIYLLNTLLLCFVDTNGYFMIFPEKVHDGLFPNMAMYLAVKTSSGLEIRARHGTRIFSIQEELQKKVQHWPKKDYCSASYRYSYVTAMCMYTVYVRVYIKFIYIYIRMLHGSTIKWPWSNFANLMMTYPSRTFQVS